MLEMAVCTPRDVESHRQRSRHGSMDTEVEPPEHGRQHSARSLSQSADRAPMTQPCTMQLSSPASPAQPFAWCTCASGRSTAAAASRWRARTTPSKACGESRLEPSGSRHHRQRQRAGRAVGREGVAIVDEAASWGADAIVLGPGPARSWRRLFARGSPGPGSPAVGDPGDRGAFTQAGLAVLDDKIRARTGAPRRLRASRISEKARPPPGELFRVRPAPLRLGVVAIDLPGWSRSRPATFGAVGFSLSGAAACMGHGTSRQCGP